MDCGYSCRRRWDALKGVQQRTSVYRQCNRSGGNTRFGEGVLVRAYETDIDHRGVHITVEDTVPGKGNLGRRRRARRQKQGGVVVRASRRTPCLTRRLAPLGSGDIDGALLCLPHRSFPTMTTSRRHLPLLSNYHLSTLHTPPACILCTRQPTWSISRESGWLWAALSRRYLGGLRAWWLGLAASLGRWFGRVMV